MPIYEAHEALPAPPPIVMIYGDPGCGKTTLGNTCLNPLLIDADKGVQRSKLRKRVLVPVNWEEILEKEKEGEFAKADVIVIDTPKAVLDDYLFNYVIRNDYQLANNNLRVYGAIANEFKAFVNRQRELGKTIFILCHAKKDEDTKGMIPDVTGGSASLLYRVADQIGYLTIRNGKRVITFEPTQKNVGKNTAGLTDIEVPHVADPKFQKFGQEIINAVTSAMEAMSEEQRIAFETMQTFQDTIGATVEPLQLTGIFNQILQLPDYLKFPLRQAVIDHAAEAGWKWNKDQQQYEEVPAIVKDDPPAPSAFDMGKLTKALGKCKNGQQVTDLYFEHVEVIEANQQMIDMVNAAMQAFGGKDIAGIGITAEGGQP